MGTFKSEKTFYASHSLIPIIARDIVTDFSDEGYKVLSQDLISGGYDISITKGGLFKAVLGLKTALKVNIYPQTDSIRIEAGVGIFGQQAVPTVISMLIFWPVLITQLTGIISQTKMDDRVMKIAEATISREKPQNGEVNTHVSNFSTSGKFCTQCGRRFEANDMFCSGCGRKI